MKFKSKYGDVILEPKSEIAIEQLRKNPDYEEVKEEKNADTNKSDKAKGDKSK